LPKKLLIIHIISLEKFIVYFEYLNYWHLVMLNLITKLLQLDHYGIYFDIKILIINYYIIILIITYYIKI